MPLRSPDSSKSSRLPSPENGAWDKVRSGWRQLYGNVFGLGVSVEEHRFPLDQPLDWARSFHPGTVELCLNLQGSATIESADHQVQLQDRSAVLYIQHEPPLTATRMAGEHWFLTLELQPSFFASQGMFDPMTLLPEIALWLNRSHNGSWLSRPRLLTLDEETLSRTLSQPPVPEGCRSLWFCGKVMELMAHFLFCSPRPEVLLCSRLSDQWQLRLARATQLLLANLDAPPDLTTLAQLVGCSPHYLSRMFRERRGQTITEFIRVSRLERAAELLKLGTHNVTEAAFAVGYSSLSNFSKAFKQHFGRNPVEF